MRIFSREKMIEACKEAGVELRGNTDDIAKEIDGEEVHFKEKVGRVDIYDYNGLPIPGQWTIEVEK